MVIEMMVLDKEADVEVNQEVDKEVTKVVEVDKELVNEGLALVCRYGDGRRGDHKVNGSGAGAGQGDSPFKRYK